MRRLTVDPGIRGCGTALFDASTLLRAAYVRNPCKSGNGPHECREMAWQVALWVKGYVPVREIIFEWPRVYTAAKLEGDPNDLPPLVGIDCAIAAFFPGVPVLRYFPEQWKGTTDKEVMNARVMSRLSDVERGRVEDAGHLTHNVLDAVGIGLHHIGRLVRRRVFAR